MKLIIDSSSWAKSDGRQWAFFQKDGTTRPQARAFFSGLHDLGAFLVRRGLIQPTEVQDGGPAEEVVETFLCTFRDTKDFPQDSLMFAKGRFILTRANGDWILSNPTRDVFRGQVGDVGYPPSVAAGVWLAVDRTFKALPDTIPYSSTNTRMAEVAREVVSQ